MLLSTVEAAGLLTTSTVWAAEADSSIKDVGVEFMGSGLSFEADARQDGSRGNGHDDEIF